VFVYVCRSTKLTIDCVKMIVKSLDSGNCRHALVVYMNELTPQAREAVQQSGKYMFELFLLEELQYNVTKHFLVPRHEKLEKHEAKEILQTYGATQIPRMLKSDPIARFYNFKRGDIILCYRRDGDVSARLVR